MAELDRSGKLTQTSAADVEVLDAMIKTLKKEAIETLVGDVDKALKTAPDSVALNYLKCAKGLLKGVRIIEALGLFFDLLSIGINA